MLSEKNLKWITQVAVSMTINPAKSLARFNDMLW